MRFTMLMLLALAVPGGQTDATSQARPSLRVVLSDIDYPEALECGVTQASVQSAAARALRASGIRVVPESDPFLHVQVTVLRTAGPVCTLHALVSVRGIRRDPAAGAFKARRGSSASLLCQESFLGLSHMRWAGDYFAYEVEDRVRRCLDALEY